MYVLFPYIIFSIVFAPNPLFSKIDKHMDLSYGIYLYGFFFQQLVMSLLQKYGIGMSYTQVMLVCAIPTIIAAILSFYLVERPMIRLSHWLVKKMKKKG